MNDIHVGFSKLFDQEEDAVDFILSINNTCWTYACSQEVPSNKWRVEITGRNDIYMK